VLAARLLYILRRKFTALWLLRWFNTSQLRRGMTARVGSCVRMLWATTNRASGECSVISMGEKPRADHCPSGDEGIWRCLSLIKLSSVELLDSPWRTEPHAPQRCVENIEVDAENYPGGDPQNGQ
jgi:hypothetical protein